MWCLRHSNQAECGPPGDRAKPAALAGFLLVAVCGLVGCTLVPTRVRIDMVNAKRSVALCKPMIQMEFSKNR
jgi:hypothetical protein